MKYCEQLLMIGLLEPRRLWRLWLPDVLVTCRSVPELIPRLTLGPLRCLRKMCEPTMCPPGGVRIVSRILTEVNVISDTHISYPDGQRFS